MKQSLTRVPTFDSMFIPTIQALENLGCSGPIEEIYEQVIQLLNLNKRDAKLRELGIDPDTL
jgi:restriction system protein